MSLRQAAQKAWKGTKKLQAKTIGQLQAQSVQMRRTLTNSRARINFVLKLMTWRTRSDARGVAARFLLATMPKILDPTMTMTISSVEDAKRVKQELANWSKYERTSSREMKARWVRTLRFVNQAESSSINQVEIYSKGSKATSAMWESIRGAKRRIWLTTYILKPDEIGLKMIEELTSAARRGVQVAFIYDHFGSFGFNEVHLDELRAAGGMVLCFNSIRNLANFFRFDLRSNYVLYRNHRKVLVIDDAVGYCGGMNIAADYCGEDIGGNGRFRDTHSRIVGPGVAHLASVFVSTLQTMQSQSIPEWPEVMKKVLMMQEEMSPTSSTPESQPSSEPIPTASTKALSTSSKPRQPRNRSEDALQTAVSKLVGSRRPFIQLAAGKQAAFTQVLASNNREKKRAIQKALSETIDLAQKHVYLTSPYFLPPLSIRQAIIRAAKRGVDVRILTAGQSDIPFITSASAHIYGLFLRHGVRIYELQNQELHAKTVTSDGGVAMVGSYNLDNLSYKHNLEANLNFLDNKLAVDLERQFFEDLKYSKEVIKSRWDNRPWYKRVWHWTVYSLFNLLLR